MKFYSSLLVAGISLDSSAEANKRLSLRSRSLISPPKIEKDKLETIVSFNHSEMPPETPASLVVGGDDIFVSLGFNGQICKIDSANPGAGCQPFAQIDIFTSSNPCGVPGKIPIPVLLGLAIDEDYVYAAANSCDSSQHGIHKIKRSNPTDVKIFKIPHGADGFLANGIAVHKGIVYMSDYFFFNIFSVDTNKNPQGAQVRLFSNSMLLTPDPRAAFQTGPNGLNIKDGILYSGFSGNPTIVQFDMNSNDKANNAHVIVNMTELGLVPSCCEKDGCAEFENLLGGNPALPLPVGSSCGTPPSPFHPDNCTKVCDVGFGIDDFAFDPNGNIIVTTDPFNTVIFIDMNGLGVSQILYDNIAGGTGPGTDNDLDGPTDVAFADDGKTVYISNAAFPLFIQPEYKPSVMKTIVEVKL